MGASKRLFEEIREGDTESPYAHFYDQSGQLLEVYQNTVLGTEEGFFIPDDVIAELQKEKFVKPKSSQGYLINSPKGINLKNPKTQNNG